MTVTFLSIVAIGIIVYFVGILATKLIFSLHLDDVNHAIFGRYENLTDQQIKFIQVFQTLGFFVLPGLFLFWLFSNPDDNYFGITLKVKPILYLLTISAIVISIPFINWIIHINDLISFPDSMRGIEQSVQESEALHDDFIKRLLTADNLPKLIFSIFMIGILPAIGEEFIFRGVFQKIFLEASKSVHFAVIITAIIFSFVHGQFHGFFARFLLGIFLGYIMVWGKTIWLPVVGHFIFNTLNILILYFMDQGGEDFSFGINNHAISVLVLPLSIILTSTAIFFIYKNSKRRIK
jgi:membrane protease YdiL (CAAX protease family)